MSLNCWCWSVYRRTLEARSVEVFTEGDCVGLRPRRWFTQYGWPWDAMGSKPRFGLYNVKLGDEIYEYRSYMGESLEHYIGGRSNMSNMAGAAASPLQAWLDSHHQRWKREKYAFPPADCQTDLRTTFCATSPCRVIIFLRFSRLNPDFFAANAGLVAFQRRLLPYLCLDGHDPLQHRQPFVLCLQWKVLAYFDAIGPNRPGMIWGILDPLWFTFIPLIVIYRNII